MTFSRPTVLQHIGALSRELPCGFRSIMHISWVTWPQINAGASSRRVTRQKSGSGIGSRDQIQCKALAVASTGRGQSLRDIFNA